MSKYIILANAKMYALTYGKHQAWKNYNNFYYIHFNIHIITETTTY